MARRKAKGDGGGGGGGAFSSITGTPTEVAYFDATTGNGTSNPAFWVDETTGFDLFVYDNAPPTITYGVINSSGVTGIDDLTYAGTFTGADTGLVSTLYTVTMGKSDAFTWTSNQGGSGGSTAPVTGFALDNGITIDLPSTGYNETDVWTFQIEVISNEVGSVYTKTLKLISTGDTGTIDISSPASASYGLVLPPAQGASGETLINDGSGNMSWGSGVFLLDTTGPGGFGNIYSSDSGFVPGTSDAVFIAGEQAGMGATGDFTGSQWIGLGAGSSSIDAAYSVFIGAGAGGSAENANGAVFIGSATGDFAIDAFDSVFIGGGAGQDSNNSSSSNFLGVNAGSTSDGVANNYLGAYSGQDATGNYNNFLGFETGRNATGAENSFFAQRDAGRDSVGADHSIFIGENSGKNSDGAQYSNFLGFGSGQLSVDVSNANVFGRSAGYDSEDSQNVNWFGQNAGYQAFGASNTNFFGQGAGYQANNSSNAIAIGAGAGALIDGARNAIFLGAQAGYLDTVDNTGSSDDYSIAIGGLSSTGGFSNSIALGGRATNTATNQLMLGSSTRPINEITLNGNSDDNIITYTKKITSIPSAVNAMNTTPILTGITAPSGYAVQILDVYGGVTYNTTPYATNTGVNIAFSTAPTQSVWQNANIIGGTTSEIRRFSKTTGSGAEVVIPNDELVITNIVGDPTAGDSDLNVYITYKIIKL